MEYSPGHEVIVRIYYPTTARFQQDSLYYPPFISSQKDMLKQVPGIQINQLEQLTSLKSFSLKKAPTINDKQFPVLLFSPGFGCAAEMYENNITELVSHGYIVVGISTPFINLTDWSTLQYLPAYTTFFNHLKTPQIAQGFDLKVMFHLIRYSGNLRDFDSS